jgi:hypothetical protein
MSRELLRGDLEGPCPKSACLRARSPPVQTTGLGYRGGREEMTQTVLQRLVRPSTNPPVV